MDETAKTGGATGTSAPWHFWVIAVILLLFNGLGAFDYLATIFRYEPYLSKFSEEALAYYFAAPLWMYAIWAISVFGGFIAAILLFMRSRLAVTLFAIALLSAVIAQVYSFTNPAPDGSASLIVSAIVIGVFALVFVYLSWLRARGVLR